jgi:hypothetical protein
VTKQRLLLIICLAVNALAAEALAASPPGRAGGVAPVQDQIAPERQELLRRLDSFIRDDYLGSGLAGHENAAALYAASVDYYGRAKVPRAAVISQKQAYYRKWPTRRYEVIAGTFAVRPGANDAVEIVFRYTYELSDGRRSMRGVGQTVLGVVLSADGNFQIAKEEGGIVARAGAAQRN